LFSNGDIFALFLLQIHSGKYLQKLTN